ncbi:MAG: translocation/assembly module TamB domain-containing protein, partial [Chitinophagaceae bacterium]|nr:translocation/assembly module TamB domain-containing protein [Chitinophagaceae bacterium]
NMKLPKNGTPTYSGSIATADFDIGAFMAIAQLGKISFNGKIKGSDFRLTNMQAELDGNIKNIGYNGYVYRDIIVKGTLARKMFNGSFDANDPELKASLNGLIDFKNELPRFNFTASIDKANLQKLNLYRENIDIKAQVDFNFTGSNIDNFLGTARIHHASILKNGEQVDFDSLSITSTQNGRSRIIDVNSNQFDVHLDGEFSLYDLPNTFQTFLNRYYPSYINPPTRELQNENFSFIINTRKVDDYLDLVDKHLKGFNDATISGYINSDETRLGLKANVPNFSYKTVSFNEVSVDGSGTMDTLLLSTQVKEVVVNDSLRFPGTTVNIQSAQDVSDITINTSANRTLNAANISGQVQTLRDGVRILFNPSSFDINGKEWKIDKDGEIILSRELITSDGLRIYNEEQEVYVTTTPSSTTNANDILIALKKINIGDFTPFFIKNNRMEGLLSGSIVITDPFGKMLADGKIETEQFRLDDDSIGQVQINPSYSASSGKVSFEVLSNNKDYNFTASGFYNTKDSIEQELEISTRFENTNINLLEKYLGAIFSRIEGKATGDLRISGPLKKLKYLGAIELKDGGLLVNYTRCYYKIPQAVIRFADGYIDFGSFSIRDTLDNKADITNGRLYHEGFNNLAFDFNLRTNQLLLLNTTSADNKLFYGNVVGKATVSFRGPLQDMKMTIRGEPTDTSNIYLPIGSSRESGEADFLVWKVYGTEMQPQYAGTAGGDLTVSLDINANRYANMYDILDGLTGDVIRAKGSGNIQITVGTNENMTMEGRLDVDEGDYTFSFQAIKKRFQLKQNAGNYISWSGDPTDATINIVAEYFADNVRFKDLGIADNSSGSLLISNKEVLNYSGRIIVVATLKDKLTAPVISFRLELPPNSPLKNDQEALSIFRQIQGDVNELNKQVSFLIVFNRFGPLTSNRGASANIANAAFEGIIVNSLSGYVSKALTSEFSKIMRSLFKDEGLKININASFYNGTNLVDNLGNAQLTLPDRTNVNVSIAKSYMNERLTFVVGSALDLGLNTAQQSQSSFQFLPDVTAEWKLSQDGKFRLSFFYRDSYSYISGRSRNRSGTGISYRKEFDRIDELFRKKKKKQEP